MVRFFTIALLVCTLGLGAKAQFRTGQHEARIAKLVNAKKFAQANTLIDSLTTAHPDSLIYWQLKAETIFNQYGPDRGIDYMEQLLAKNPNDLPLLLSYSYMLGEGGKRPLADSILATAATLCDNDSCLCYIKSEQGLSKSQQQDHAAAIAFTKQAVDLCPNSCMYLGQLGYIYLIMNDYTNALKYSLESNAICENEGVMNNIALIYSETKEYVKAIEIFKKLMQYDPYNPVLLNNMGYAYVQNKDFELGISFIKESLKYWPTNSYAYRNLGLAYLKKKDKAQACQCFQKAEELGFSAEYGNELLEIMQKNCK